MFFKKVKKDEGQLKALSEKDIQKQLYGKYLEKDERGIEVMDSCAIVKEKGEPPIQEKYDAKLRNELNEELEGLRAEFKRLRDEVNRLKKERHALEYTGTAFKMPFFKTKHLVIIGSAVILAAIITLSALTIRFAVARVERKAAVKVKEAASKVYTVQAYTTSKKEDAESVVRLLSSKGFAAEIKETGSSSGKRLLYVIYVGEYSKKSQANETVQKLRKETGFKDSIVRVK